MPDETIRIDDGKVDVKEFLDGLPDGGRVVLTFDPERQRRLDEVAGAIYRVLEENTSHLATMIGRFEAEVFMLDVAYSIAATEVIDA